MTKSPATSPVPSRKRQNYLHWDDYFMATALLSAQRSKDPVTQVGACIVDEDKRIVAIGYNGFPHNISDDEFPWTKKNSDLLNGEIVDPIEDKSMYVVHAEANAILNKNTKDLKGTTLYTTLFPCNECAKLIIQSGIREVLYMSDKYSEKPKYRAARRMFDRSGVLHTKFQSAQKEIVIDFSKAEEATSSPDVSPLCQKLRDM